MKMLDFSMFQGFGAVIGYYFPASTGIFTTNKKSFSFRLHNQKAEISNP